MSLRRLPWQAERPLSFGAWAIRLRRSGRRGGDRLMRILTNTTSPYARIARIALGEKGFDLSATEIVNPWNDDAALLELNPAARVPTLATDAGLPITESLLVLLWLERKR